MSQFFVPSSGGGSSVTSFITDPATGTAIPAAGVMTIAGAGTTTVSAAGSTITITSSGGGSGITNLHADDGNTSSGAVINLIGFDGISTESNNAANFNFVLRAPGTRNLFLGQSAGNPAITGAACICVGADSMIGITSGTENICCGDSVAQALSSGSGNSVFGCVGMLSVSTGNYNSNFGFEAGINNTGSDSSNINIGYTATGASGVSNRLMIGGGTGTADGQLSSAFINGIFGATVVGTAVLCSAAGQLGTVVSSERFKERIVDLNEESSPVLDLRPVSFFYKDESAFANTRDKQSGLIAEEVAKVLPGLVVYDQDNLPVSVKYHELPVLLLNELKKALSRIEALENKK